MTDQDILAEYFDDEIRELQQSQSSLKNKVICAMTVLDKLQNELDYIERAIKDWVDDVRQEQVAILETAVR